MRRYDTGYSGIDKENIMEYREDEYLMISGIQHFSFCRRQWALIHIEQQWAENEHTVIGELMHKKAHDPYLTEEKGCAYYKSTSDFFTFTRNKWRMRCSRISQKRAGSKVVWA